jgi:hypothetical protein
LKNSVCQFGPSSRLGVAGQVEGLEKMALHHWPRRPLRTPGQESRHRGARPPPARAGCRPPHADPAGRRAWGSRRSTRTNGVANCCRKLFEGISELSHGDRPDSVHGSHCKPATDERARVAALIQPVGEHALNCASTNQRRPSRRMHAQEPGASCSSPQAK